MPYSWGRSGVAMATHHTLEWFIHLRVRGQSTNTHTNTQGYSKSTSTQPSSTSTSTVYKLSTSGLMLFLTPNQQCQSTEIKLKKIKWKNYTLIRDVSSWKTYRKQSNKKIN